MISRGNSAAVNDIDIAYILDHKYWHRERGYRPTSSTNDSANRSTKRCNTESKI